MSQIKVKSKKRKIFLKRVVVSTMLCVFVLMMTASMIGVKLPDRSEVVEQAQAEQLENTPLVMNNEDAEKVGQ